jgi:hypothetical protein
MRIEGPLCLMLIAPHDRGVPRDITEHDRGELMRRICARRVRGRQMSPLPLNFKPSRPEYTWGRSSRETAKADGQRSYSANGA